METVKDTGTCTFTKEQYDRWSKKDAARFLAREYGDVPWNEDDGTERHMHEVTSPKKGLTYKVHPLANLFPLLEGQDFEKLVEDIREHGLIEPVWLWQDPKDGTEYLLDGRNRVRACEAAGVEWRYEWWSGDPVAFVLSVNMLRRHLSPGQRAAMAMALLDYRRASAKARKSAGVAAQRGEGGKFGPKTQAAPTLPRGGESADNHGEVAQVAKEVGIGRGTVERVAKVRREAPELMPDIVAGTLTPRAAERKVKERKRRAADADHERAEQERSCAREVADWKQRTIHLLTAYPHDVLDAHQADVVDIFDRLGTWVAGIDDEGKAA